MTRRRIITAALAAAILTVCLILFLCARLGNRPVTVTSTGPLDIRLWGIRPDAGDAIYDPNGTKIAETLGNARRDRAVWENNAQRRDFIFEIPDTNEPITFRPLQCLADGAEGRWGNFVKSVLYFEHNGRNLGWFQAYIPRTVRKTLLFGLWKRDVAVNSIDLRFQYYCGPPRKPICLFKGPFEAEQKMTDETGLYEISFVPHPDPSQKELVLRCCAKQGIDEAAHALFYDIQGKRHYTMKGWQRGKWKPGKATREELWYTIPGMRPGVPPEIPPKNIAMITIGEEPFETTVENLRLLSLNSEQRAHAEHLDSIAEKLDPGREATCYARYNFRDLNRLLEVIDLLRGEQIYRISRSLCFRQMGMVHVDPGVLNAEQLRKLKQTALRWSNAMDPEIRLEAVRLGLQCGWPEFYDVAFDLLEYQDRNYFRGADPARDAAELLYGQRENLSEQHVKRIAEFLSRRSHPGKFNRLLNCLEHPKSPARITALWDFADCDQPWIWINAIRRLSMWREYAGKHDSLPEKIKVRVYLVTGPYGFSDPDRIGTEVAAVLPALLSGHSLTDHASVYGSLLGHVPENIDREAMTSILIESLRQMEYHPSWSLWGAISRIVKCINLWHGLDIGGLGCDVRKQTPDLDKMDLEAVAAEAVEWYDTFHSSADPNAAQ